MSTVKVNDVDTHQLDDLQQMHLQCQVYWPIIGQGYRGHVIIQQVSMQLVQLCCY